MLLVGFVHTFWYKPIDLMTNININIQSLVDQYGGIKELCINAAEHGRLDILQLAHKNGQFSVIQNLSIKVENLIASIAAEFGHLHILEFFKNNNINFNVYLCAKSAARSGFLHIIEWLHQNGCYPASSEENGWACYCAAQGGHLHVLQWLREHGYQWDFHVCAVAADSGHFHVLQWAHEEGGCPLTEIVCCAAASRGYLNILQWARNKGCPWDENFLFQTAIINGHLHILQWALENGCNFDVDMFENTIVATSHTSMVNVLNLLSWTLKWAREHNYEINIKRIFAQVIYSRDKLYIAKFLFEKKYINMTDIINCGNLIQIFDLNRFETMNSSTNFEFHRLKDIEWFEEIRLKVYKLKFNLFKLKIEAFDTVLLNVIEVPDIVNLIKCYM